MYPHIVESLYTNPNNQFDIQQLELLFEPLGDSKEKLLNLLHQREDYTYFHGIHQIINSITGDKMMIKMNEYDLDVKENDENHIIFDMMCSFSQNFYMIKA